MENAIDILLNNECRQELIRLGYTFGEGNNIYSTNGLPSLTNLGKPKIIGGKYFMDITNHYSEFELYQQYKHKKPNNSSQ